MVSKIIQREKDVQDQVIAGGLYGKQQFHKHRLINFKEYLIEIVSQTANAKIEYDIKELTKMIERYP